MICVNVEVIDEIEYIDYLTYKQHWDAKNQEKEKIEN